MQVVLLYFYCPYGSLHGVNVAVVVHGRACLPFQFLQPFGQFFQRLVCQCAAQFVVLRHWRKLITLQHRLDVESRSAAHYRLFATRNDVVVGIEKILLIFKQVVFRSWLAYIYEVIRYFLAVDDIVGKVFARANVHSAVHLSRVGAQYFAVQPVGEGGGEGCLAACRRTENGYQPAVVCRVSCHLRISFTEIYSCKSNKNNLIHHYYDDYLFSLGL